MRALVLFILLFAGGLAQAAEACPRIVSQSPYITHTLEWMGLKQCIVGTSRYEDLGLPQTGGVLDPDAEAIALLEPAVILSSDWISEERARQITPADSRIYRLHGFQSMQQIEDNIRTIAKAADRDNGEALAEKFHQQWREAIKGIRAGHKKVLLISSCSGAPYSFGKTTWLYDLFTQAGFEVVETHDNIHHIESAKLGDLIDELQPELVFIFERKAARQCQMITPKIPTRIVTLDGETLLQPAPLLLQGLDELARKQAIWN
jgi:ABC-type hemin transport system substrate-binding protein